MNNRQLFLAKLIEAEAVGLPFDHVIGALKSIYLVNDIEVARLLDALNNEDCARISSLQVVKAIGRWKAAYGEALFGDDEAEVLILAAKEAAFQKLTKIKSEGDLTLEDLLNSDDNHAQGLAGLILYYGHKNMNYGKNLLLKAADQGDVDALLWELSEFPQKAKSILTMLANNSMFLANPQDLEVYKEHYKIDEIAIIDRPLKLGFHN